VFSDCDEEVKLAMYEYGRHLGLAFQVVDDILDFTQSTAALGKPQGQDLASGNITAPILFALEDPVVGKKLLSLLNSKFKAAGSFEEGLRLVEAGGGIERARLLAREEGDKALTALNVLPPSDARDSMAMMVEYVLERLH
jgi:all-trans-nonaprenyl-diphosphate synthase